MVLSLEAIEAAIRRTRCAVCADPGKRPRARRNRALWEEALPLLVRRGVLDERTRRAFMEYVRRRNALVAAGSALSIGEARASAEWADRLTVRFEDVNL